MSCMAEGHIAHFCIVHIDQLQRLESLLTQANVSIVRHGQV